MNSLYSQLFEDELIDIKRKSILLEKINVRIKDETKDLIVKEEKPSDKKEGYIYVLTLTSIIAGMVSFIAPLYSLKLPMDNGLIKLFNMIPIILGVLITMFISLYITRNIIEFKTKEPSQTSPTRSRIQEMISFENEIIKKLKMYKFSNIKRNYFYQNKKISGVVDIYAKKNNKEYLIEIKYFGRIFPKSIILRLNEIAKSIKKKNKNSILVLITKEKIDLEGSSLKELLNEWDYILNSSSIDRLKEI